MSVSPASTADALPAPAAPGALTPQDRVQIAIAWCGWAALAVVMATLAARRPEASSVTPVYREAFAAFRAGLPMYTPGPHGWLYPPHSALLYAPFTLGPAPLGEAMYRLASVALLAWSLWRLARLASPRGLGDYFPMITLLALPACAGAVRNGQMNIALAAAMALATVDLALGDLARGHRARRERTAIGWRAAAWLALATVTKPMGVVPALLAVGLRPRLAVPLGVLVLATLLAPFANPDWAYVGEQYRASIVKMREAGAPAPGTFADLAGLLWSLGVTPPPAALTGLRVLAAPLTLALAWLAVRRRHAPEGWVLVLGLAATYLMLFNPRTEGVSYPILMPPLAALTCWALFRDRRWPLGGLLVALSVVMAIAHVFSRGGDVVLRPLGAAIFAGVLMWWIAIAPRAPAGATVTPTPPAAT